MRKFEYKEFTDKNLDKAREQMLAFVNKNGAEVISVFEKFSSAGDYAQVCTYYYIEVC